MSNTDGVRRSGRDRLFEMTKDVGCMKRSGMHLFRGRGEMVHFAPLNAPYGALHPARMTR